MEGPFNVIFIYVILKQSASCLEYGAVTIVYLTHPDGQMTSILGNAMQREWSKQRMKKVCAVKLVLTL